MLISIPSVGTHAELYGPAWRPTCGEKLAYSLKKLAGKIAEVTFGCHHRNLSLPFSDHQTCLDCGATRLYIYNTEMYLDGVTDAPIFMGRWKKALPPELPVAQAPAGFPQTLRHCTDCGSVAAASSSCPNITCSGIGFYDRQRRNCGKAERVMLAASQNPAVRG